MFDEVRAQYLLQKCRGDEIWSVELCRQLQIPEDWIEELQDCFESGFTDERLKIYRTEGLTNQYHGLLDVDIAFRCAEFLGIDTAPILELPLSRTAQVRRLQSDLDEL